MLGLFSCSGTDGQIISNLTNKYLAGVTVLYVQRSYGKNIPVEDQVGSIQHVILQYTTKTQSDVLSQIYNPLEHLHMSVVLPMCRGRVPQCSQQMINRIIIQNVKNVIT